MFVLFLVPIIFFIVLVGLSVLFSFIFIKPYERDAIYTWIGRVPYVVYSTITMKEWKCKECGRLNSELKKIKPIGMCFTCCERSKKKNYDFFCYACLAD